MVWFLMFACSSDAASPPDAVNQAPEGFWDHWGDGKAELAGYALKQPRYGELRDGTVVLITVTEDFSDARRVKADRPGSGVHPVLKLNAVRDFQTGIYDYNVMTSSFLRLDGSDAWGVPTKIAFSSQEWCGHVYDQLLTHDTKFDRTVHSYFDGEDLSETTAIPAGAVFADALPLIVRGLVGEPIAPGAERQLQLYPRLFDLRMLHQKGSFQSATLSRAAEPATITVPAGAFEVDRYTLVASDGTSTFDVERAAPHRLVRWEGVKGEVGELTGSFRTPYWQQNHNGDERFLEPLHLPDRAPIAP